MKKVLPLIKIETLYMLVLITVLVIIGSSFNRGKAVVYDINNNRAVQTVRLVSKYNPVVTPVKVVKTFNEVLKYGPNSPIAFSGSMTAYGPDCKGCSGNLACPPRHNAKNGNIYFKDSKYGKIRILAADSKIPCGTIVQVSGLKNSKPFYGVVLDRGGVIKGTLFDLLFTSQKQAGGFGRQKANYKIIRWGW